MCGHHLTYAELVVPNPAEPILQALYVLLMQARTTAFCTEVLYTSRSISISVQVSARPVFHVCARSSRSDWITCNVRLRHVTYTINIALPTKIQLSGIEHLKSPKASQSFICFAWRPSGCERDSHGRKQFVCSLKTSVSFGFSS